MGRPSKNAVFSHYFLPGFWTLKNLIIMPVLTGISLNIMGPESGQGKLADLDGLADG